MIMYRFITDVIYRLLILRYSFWRRFVCVSRAEVITVPKFTIFQSFRCLQVIPSIKMCQVETNRLPRYLMYLNVTVKISLQKLFVCIHCYPLVIMVDLEQYQLTRTFYRVCCFLYLVMSRRSTRIAVKLENYAEQDDSSESQNDTPLKRMPSKRQGKKNVKVS